MINQLACALPPVDEPGVVVNTLNPKKGHVLQFLFHGTTGTFVIK